MSEKYSPKKGDVVISNSTPFGRPHQGVIMSLDSKGDAVVAFDDFVSPDLFFSGWPHYGKRCCWFVSKKNFEVLWRPSLTDESYNDLFV